VGIEFSIDTSFIALLPAINLNFHSSTLEFEWLIFGIYLDFN
jgi:hypothetical protein